MKVWQSQSGLTLLEVVVVISLFSVLLLATSRMFVKTTDVQQRTINEHDLQADLRYGLGVLLYEAEKNVIKCTTPGNCSCCGQDLINKYYFTNGSNLCFWNDSSQCVSYYLQNNKIMVTRGATTESLTSDEVQVTDLKFAVPTNQNRFTVMTSVEKSNQKYTHELKIQTSITATSYED